MTDAESSGVQKGVRMVRRPRASTLRGIQGAGFRENVGKWQKRREKCRYRGM